jgi:hypothetical protein
MLQRLGKAIVLVGIVAFVHGNSVRSDFVWDDRELILMNDFILHGSPSTLLGPEYFAATREYSYRPLSTAAHLLNARLLGLTSRSFRLVNVLRGSWEFGPSTPFAFAESALARRSGQRCSTRFIRSTPRPSMSERFGPT